MPWVNEPGKKPRLVHFPWVSNPEYHSEMKSKGKGPANWYRENTWKVQVEQTSGSSFIVGAGTNPVSFPSYLESDDKARVVSMDAIIGRSKHRQKIWSETDGLLADPLEHTGSALATFKGSWVTKNDLRLRARETEILGIIDANPGIKITSLALVYNTTNKNILRILMLAGASGVRFSRLADGKVKVLDWGIYDKAKVRLLFTNSNGLEEIVGKAKSVFEDVSDERTGHLIRDKVKSELRELWKRKILEDENKSGGSNVIR